MPAVRLLLDTHVFPWWRAADRRLRAAVRQAIAEAEIVFVSAASAWEAAIKVALGRLRIPDTVEAGVIDSGFERLPINSLMQKARCDSRRITTTRLTAC
ncbi:MAG: type II toxin-antitoxin system VapC family toxin [Candidatus Binatia bacterium]